jgi:hypothetical protein
MKTKKFDKKLILNKKTLTRLENVEMKVAKAGGNPWVENPTTPVPCP